MTRIDSKRVNVNATPQVVFDYLADMHNFKELLPQDKITNWQSDGRSCSFKINGAYTIGLEHDQLIPPGNLLLKSSAEAPFKFTLDIKLEPQGEQTLAYQICLADINPFLKMMVEGPLKNLFDYITDRLAKRFS